MNGELIKLALTPVGSDVQCSQYGCAHYEDFVTNVSEDHLNYMASNTDGTIIRLSSSKRSGKLDVQIWPPEPKAFISSLGQAIDSIAPQEQIGSN